MAREKEKFNINEKTYGEIRDINNEQDFSIFYESAIRFLNAVNKERGSIMETYGKNNQS